MHLQAGACLLEPLPAGGGMQSDQRNDFVQAGTKHVVQKQYGARIDRHFVERRQKFGPHLLTGEGEPARMGRIGVHARQTDQRVAL